MKTMIVFTKFKMEGVDGAEWIESHECAEIGKKADIDDYKTGTKFLASIKRMYRSAGAEYKILNVVIG